MPLVATYPVGLLILMAFALVSHERPILAGPALLAGIMLSIHLWALHS